MKSKVVQDMYCRGIIIALKRVMKVFFCPRMLPAPAKTWVGWMLYLVLGRLLLDLLLALDHDHGQEGEDDGQSEDEKHAGDADRVFSWREVSVQEVCLVHKWLYP